MRRIGVVTVGRSDFGMYSPVLKRITDSPDLDLQLIVSGSHLSPDFGYTVVQIEAEGFNISDRVEMLTSSDSPEGISKAMGLGLIGFGQLYAHSRPDILLVLGDRFEMHAAALAALPFKIPIGHIGGGEVTEGAFDEALRHSITKLSHLHFVAAHEYKERVVQMGEEPWRIIVSGSPAIDNIHNTEILNRQHLESQTGLALAEAPVVVTYHPVTLEYEQTKPQITALLEALGEFGQPVVFTMSNPDTNGRLIWSMVEEFVESHAQAQAVKNLGSQRYFSLLSCATALVGNSSSGIIEAASFELPVVNIGNRQRGRMRSPNVIDVGYSIEEILLGIRKAVSPCFRSVLKGLVNPYGDGHASEVIVSNLEKVELNPELIVKRFTSTAEPKN